MKLKNLTPEDIGSGITLTITNVTSEEFPSFERPGETNHKVVLHFDETEKILITNNNILEKLNEANGDPKKWAGLVVDVAWKEIIVTKDGKETPVKMKYIENVHGVERKPSLLDEILSKL